MVETDLAGLVDGFTTALSADASYSSPDAPRKTARSLLEGGSPDGFSVNRGRDSATGRDYTVARSSGGDGLYLVDLSAPMRVVFQVPHPNTDLDTQQIGLALFRAVPGSMLMVSGTNRRVMDAAHDEDSVFQALAVRLADKDVPQVQIHGFHDDSLPSVDVVISPGSAATGSLVRGIASSLDNDFDVCRGWDSKCGQLEGTRNVQGKACAAAKAPFAHVELSRTVRESRQDEVVAAIARGL